MGLPSVKAALRLKENKRARTDEGLFVVEGGHLVYAAEGAVEYILYSKEGKVSQWAEKRGIPSLRISKKDLYRLTSVETSQGVFAVVRQRNDSISDILKVKNPLIIFCEGLQDPGNLGTIIRSADAAGASGVLLSKGTVEVYNPKVVRSTMGSIFHMPIIEKCDLEQALKGTKGLKVIATEIAGEKNYWEANFCGPSVIMVGNEGAGLSKNIMKLCNESVKIPMPGKSESLNAAVSASLIMYEALRQRWKK